MRETLEAHIEEYNAAHMIFTPEQIERMKESIAQVDRGKVVTAEEVDSLFADLHKRPAAR